jgi:predicted DsbA family dithiol-disulfide isomerase
MHDTLISHQDELLPMHLRRYAEDLGLDVDRLWQDLHDRVYAPRVSRDVTSADESGVSGTPTFFINGRRHQGAYDIATLSAEVRAALGPRSTGQSSNRR